MEFNYMKQQDWIDFFQAVHGRKLSKQQKNSHKKRL